MDRAKRLQAFFNLRRISVLRNLVNGRPQIWRGGNVDILLILFRLLTVQRKWNFTKRFTFPFYTTKKCLMLRQQSQNWVSLAAMHLFHSCFFSHSSLSRYVAYRYQYSISCCITCQICLRSTDTCGKTPTTVT